MLWDIIYDFFVMYVFGGFSSGGEYYYSFVGMFLDNDSGSNYEIWGDYAYIKCFEIIDDNNVMYNHMLLGNYLSLIATIISIVAIVILCCLLIKKIYNICAHVIG